MHHFCENPKLGYFFSFFSSTGKNGRVRFLRGPPPGEVPPQREAPHLGVVSEVLKVLNTRPARGVSIWGVYLIFLPACLTECKTGFLLFFQSR